MNPVPVLRDVRVDLLLLEDALDLVGGHVRVVEPDRPDGAAGEVDGELEADLGVDQAAEDEQDPGIVMAARGRRTSGACR